ncbi:MAG: alanine racemase [Dehalococcoidia bacterium]|nr:alanine racemase [Dehalococcoidia bacterium]
MQPQSVSSYPWQEGRVWAEIDLDALADNVRLLKSQANGAALLAVVKANAYGHGAVAVARAALAAGADRLGVICVDEGEQLRRAGITAPILVMGHTPTAEAQRLVDLSLTPSVVSREMALALARVASERGIEVAVHLKVDTGLNRYGLPPSEAVELGRWLRDLAGIQVEGLFTHFASADEGDKSYMLEQHTLFLSVAEQLDWVPIRHVSNTATLLDMPDRSLEMVRPGLGIYGCYPSSQVNRSLPLRPALSLKSHVARLISLAPGESVSYGRTWRAPRPSLIGLVLCGYADGLPRALSNRGSVLVRGQRAPIVGRVCMDMCMVDLSDIPDVAVDDEVVIIGCQGEEEISADEVAELCGTISYEILCGISARVSRLYLRRGRIVSRQTLVLELGDAVNAPQGVLAEEPLSGRA